VNLIVSWVISMNLERDRDRMQNSIINYIIGCILQVVSFIKAAYFGSGSRLLKVL